MLTKAQQKREHAKELVRMSQSFKGHVELGLEHEVDVDVEADTQETVVDKQKPLGRC